MKFNIEELLTESRSLIVEGNRSNRAMERWRDEPYFSLLGSEFGVRLAVMLERTITLVIGIEKLTTLTTRQAVRYQKTLVSLQRCQNTTVHHLAYFEEQLVRNPHLRKVTYKLVPNR